MGGFAAYYGETNLHPVALTAVLLLSLAVLLLPRRHALLPLFAAATSIPMSQRLVMAGADFTLLRLLLLAYVARLVLRREHGGLVWNWLDSLVVLWTISGTLVMTIHYGTGAAFLNRLGWSYDILLTYFVTRCLVRNADDLRIVAKWIAILSVPVAAAFVLEWMTRYNMFSVFGGVRAETAIREGRLRCQGPFAHPILAGTFWAACLPLIWTLWYSHARRLCVLGTVAAMTIVAASASSTPVLSVLFALIGLTLFPFRRFRTSIWVGVLVCIALLHFVIMNNPVWHLIARIDVVGGSTGWHRYVIFDTFIRNFPNWYLTGESNPQSWGVWRMRDITNQYILEGLRGGLLTLSIFVLVLVRAFANVGRLLAAAEALRHKSGIGPEWVAWALGVALLLHTVTFFGVSYFGQMITIFYVQLALVGSMSGALGSARRSTPTQRAPRRMAWPARAAAQQARRAASRIPALRARGSP